MATWVNLPLRELPHDDFGSCRLMLKSHPRLLVSGYDRRTLGAAGAPNDAERVSALEGRRQQVAALEGARPWES